VVADVAALGPLPSAAVTVEKLAVRYGARRVLHDISFAIPRGGIFAIIGPAQSGKTSLLRVFNRTLEFTPQAGLERPRGVAGAESGGGARRLRAAPAAWAWWRRCPWACRFPSSITLRWRRASPARAPAH
jgi:hypothetical protein